MRGVSGEKKPFDKKTHLPVAYGTRIYHYRHPDRLTSNLNYDNDGKMRAREKRSRGVGGGVIMWICDYTHAHHDMYNTEYCLSYSSASTMGKNDQRRPHRIRGKPASRFTQRPHTHPRSMRIFGVPPPSLC